MTRLRAVLVPLDGWLVSLDRSAVPPLPPNADDTDRAVHALATERALRASIAAHGVVGMPGASQWLEAVAATARVVLLADVPRGVADAVLDQTGWRDWCGIVMTADNVAAASTADRYRQALVRAGLGTVTDGVLVVAMDAEHARVAQALGLAVVLGAPTIAGAPALPSVASPAELTVAHARALLAGARASDSPTE